MSGRYLSDEFDRFIEDLSYPVLPADRMLLKCAFMTGVIAGLMPDAPSLTIMRNEIEHYSETMKDEIGAELGRPN
jgi:hypothetical protein